MLALHLCSKIPIDNFGRNLTAHKISLALTEQLKKAVSNANDPENTFLNIVKSPAFFGVNNAFALMEYFKNSNHAKASQLHLYVYADSSNVSCIIIDNGKGITEGNLSDSLKKDNKLINYFETQLKAEDGEERQHIKSNKRGKENTQGGEGLGLAIISRILRTGAGTLEIGNMQQLTHELKQKINIISSTHQNGAVIVLTSPVHSAKLEHDYEKAKSKIMQDSNHRYLNYCATIQQDFDKSNTPCSSCSSTSSESSEDEQSEPNSMSRNYEIGFWLSHTPSSSSNSKSHLSLDLEDLRFEDNEEILSISSPESSLDSKNPSFKKDESEDSEMDSITPRPRK